MNEQWQELKETIVEMRDNNGTGTQQEVCKFLTNLMDVLEKQMQEQTGHWIDHQEGRWIYAQCSECGTVHDTQTNFCPNCGVRMVEQESEDKE